MSEEEDTKFFVHLRGLKLPEEVTKRIESQIQQIVKDEIAKLDIGPKDRGLELEDDKEYRSRFLGLSKWAGKGRIAGYAPSFKGLM